MTVAWDRFSNLLKEETDIPASDCRLFLHAPEDRQLRRYLPYLAREGRELFDSYQATHNPAVRASLVRHHYVASFTALPKEWRSSEVGELPVKPKGNPYCWFMFAGLFRIHEPFLLPVEQVYDDPRWVTLREVLGAEAIATERARDEREGGCWLFELERTQFLSERVGRLVGAGYPSGNYSRILRNWAHPVYVAENAYMEYRKSAALSDDVLRRLNSGLRD